MPIKNHKVGIYLITNICTNKVYIGQSVQLTTRWRQHKNALLAHRHHNPHLQRACDKYGIESFKYTILEECSVDRLNEQEKYWIEYYNSTDPERGYNATAGGDLPPDATGLKRSEETKEKMSKALKGREFSEETKVRMSEAAKSRPSNRKGQKMSDESKRKMSESKKTQGIIPPSRKGYKMTDEERQSMIISKTKMKAITKICPTCGNGFTTKEGSREKTYCSKKCSANSPKHIARLLDTVKKNRKAG